MDENMQNQSEESVASKAEYLGDGVYASFDGYQIWLAANDPQNKVVALEPEVFAALVAYAEELRAKLKQ
jgi:hypothetical protein